MPAETTRKRGRPVGSTAPSHVDDGRGYRRRAETADLILTEHPTRTTIKEAIYWPGEGYGCGSPCENLDHAKERARESLKMGYGRTSRNRVRIIETLNIKRPKLQNNSYPVGIESAREATDNKQFVHPEVRLAQMDAVRYSIPRYVYQSWKMKFHDARARGIVFDFTLLRWHLWWIGELIKLGPDAKRGRRRGDYMMCRFNDIGAYRTGNVYAGTHKQNSADTRKHHDFSKQCKMWHATHICHLKGKVGDDHPKSRAVVTESGMRYGSIALASAAAGITRQGGFYRVRRGEWSYERSAAGAPTIPDPPHSGQTIRLPPITLGLGR